MLISHLASVVIREFNIVGIPVFESKTYAPLVIDGNGILPFSFPFQFVKSITRGHLQILQPSRVIDIFQPPYCPPTNIWRKPSRFPCLVQFMCMPVSKRFDHALIVICHVTRVNRGMNTVACILNSVAASCTVEADHGGWQLVLPMVFQAVR